MSHVRAILEDLRACCDDIVASWYARMEGHPWLRLPETVTLDHMPELIDATVAALLGQPSVEEGRRRAIAYAWKHGEHRREQGLDDGVLLREHHLLRASVWEVLSTRHARDPARFDAMALFDVATTTITTASLNGFHRAGEERDGTTRRLAGESPWPPPP